MGGIDDNVRGNLGAFFVEGSGGEVVPGHGDARKLKDVLVPVVTRNLSFGRVGIPLPTAITLLVGQCVLRITKPELLRMPVSEVIKDGKLPDGITATRVEEGKRGSPIVGFDNSTVEVNLIGTHHQMFVVPNGVTTGPLAEWRLVGVEARSMHRHTFIPSAVGINHESSIPIDTIHLVQNALRDLQASGNNFVFTHTPKEYLSLMIPNGQSLLALFNSQLRILSILSNQSNLSPVIADDPNKRRMIWDFFKIMLGFAPRGFKPKGLDMQNGPSSNLRLICTTGSEGFRVCLHYQ